MNGMTLADAAERTEYSIAKMILQSSSELDDIFQFLQFSAVYGATDFETYLRRKGKVKGRFRQPGSTIKERDVPQTEPVRVQLREMANMMPTKSYVQGNMSRPFDQRALNREEIIKDMARDVVRVAVAGRYMDTALIEDGGGIDSSIVAKGTTIDPGCYHVEQEMPGAIKFKKATGTLEYRAPIDKFYGEPVKVVSGETYTFRSYSPSHWISFTVGTLPADDGHTQISFMSSENEPDGLINIVDPSQKFKPKNPNGDSMSFDIIELLKDKLAHLYVEGEVVAVMHPRQLRALRSRARSMGGAKIEDVPFGNRKIPVWDGIPLLRSQHVPDRTYGKNKTAHSVFLANVNSTKGFFGLAMGGTEGTGFQQAGGELADGTPVLGFLLRDLGAARDFVGVEDQAVWWGAFGNRSIQAIAEYEGVFDEGY